MCTLWYPVCSCTVCGCVVAPLLLLLLGMLAFCIYLPVVLYCSHVCHPHCIYEVHVWLNRYSCCCYCIIILFCYSIVKLAHWCLGIPVNSLGAIGAYTRHFSYHFVRTCVTSSKSHSDCVDLIR